MVRRISTTIAALATALLIYAVFVGVILNRITTDFGYATTATRNRPPPGVPIFGLHVPLSVIVTACVTCLAMPLFAEFMTRLRRRRRYMNDECIECGEPITSWRGRCPGCGVRIGPG